MSGSPLIFKTLQTIITYILSESSKSNDEDMGILERFAEREGKAGTFLTLEKRLPPPNFRCERIVLVAADGSRAVIATRAVVGGNP
jgi:hypothetical protein